MPASDYSGQVDYFYGDQDPVYDRQQAQGDLGFEEYPAYDDYGDRLSSEFLESVPSPGNLGPVGNILVTGALVFALSSLFTSHLNLNETATNSTVPWGLWALPTSLTDFSLPTLPNVADVPGIGRRKRQVSEDSTGLPKFSSFESAPPSLGDEDPLDALSNNRETTREKRKKGDRRPRSLR